MKTKTGRVIMALPFYYPAFEDRNNILYPVPHRQFVFSIPILLRVYFKYDRVTIFSIQYPTGSLYLAYLFFSVSISNTTGSF
jgi:hypothetical protein